MKLNYQVISSSPELIVKFFYEGENGKYGEFYFRFNREAKDANNPTDKLGVRGQAELQRKDADYSKDLMEAIKKELGGKK